jgi:hypothetical protein
VAMPATALPAPYRRCAALAVGDSSGCTGGAPAAAADAAATALPLALAAGVRGMLAVRFTPAAGEKHENTSHGRMWRPVNNVRVLRVLNVM